MAFLEPTFDHIVIPRPSGNKVLRQHLCGDKGYAGYPAGESMRNRNYIPHVRQRGEDEKSSIPSAQMGSGEDAFMVESLPETVGPI